MKHLSSDRVFIVHGHNEEAKREAEQHVRHLGLNPIILHDQPNKGRTIIEKFEGHSEVAFAIILMTPDDLGGANTPGVDLLLRPRARQNVILELGFFIARLGRERVSTLVLGQVETPSDYHGVVYIPMDDQGTWKSRVETELRAAGLPVRPQPRAKPSKSTSRSTIVYRRRRTSSTWHFCRNCSAWPPTGAFRTRAKPSPRNICKECQAKARTGRCRPLRPDEG